MRDQDERHFLGWDAPALPRVADRLLERAASHELEEADLGEHVVVLPGARAGRVLSALLMDRAVKLGLALTPPAVITPGEIPVFILGPAGAPAPAITRRFAWIEALRALTDADRAPLLPIPMEPGDTPGWSRLAATLEQLSDNLAADGLRFRDVALDDSLAPEEAERWVVLGAVQDAAERALLVRGFTEDALATAAQVLSNTTPGHIHNIISLVGVPELSRVERAALARSPRSVTAYVFAPAADADRFDELGCVIPQAWLDATVELGDSRALFADNPTDQAELALVELALRADRDTGEIDPARVTIGIADPAALAPVRRRAALHSRVRLRPAAGEPALRATPGRLLALLGEYLRDRSFDALARLIRHPDIEAALLDKSIRSPDNLARKSTEHWLVRLDTIRRKNVLGDPETTPRDLASQPAAALRFVRSALADLLGGAFDAPAARRPLAEWADAIDGALRRIYTTRELSPALDADRRTRDALAAIRDALDDIATIAHADMPAWHAIGLIEDRLRRVSIPDPPDRDSIEALGWLELALDPAPVCVVVGLAEAHVPGSVAHDPFLPDSRRASLGMPTCDTRLARDTFLLAAINASRDAVFITTRLGPDGDPQTPSRLLFRITGDALAHRVRRFTRPELDTPRATKIASRLAPGGRDLFTPRLVIDPDYTPPTSMRVTDFAAYLRSPAGWYLERVLNLKDQQPPPRELTPAIFGSVAHTALESFGRSDARDLDDPDAIAAALSDFLSEAVDRRLGARPPAAVRVQIELMRDRLRVFASAQAQRRREGWRIAHVEWTPAPDAGAHLDTDSAPMPLLGKIDRIDSHEPSGAIAVIDYKTGVEKSADTAHRTRRGWFNLQLPLYRRLIGALGDPPRLDLGYAFLTSKSNAMTWRFADWSADELARADEVARDVVRRVRAYQPGDIIEPGAHPPAEGSLGFITGARFDLIAPAPPEADP